MAKKTLPNRRYTDEFKLEALRLAESTGINQAAKRLGIRSDFPQALFTLISKSVSKIPYPNPTRKLGRPLNNVNALCLP
jgi:hypothetical protein